MRIAYDVRSTVGAASGIGVYTRSLIDALRRVEPDWNLIELGTDRTADARVPERLWWETVTLPNRIRGVAPDLFHATGFALPRRLRCARVLTVHDLIALRVDSRLPVPSRFYWKRWLPASVRRADAILADSEATRRDIVELLSIPAERIRVVPLAPRDLFRDDVPAERIREMRKRFGLDRPYLLFVGNLEPRKNLGMLVEAFGRVADSLPEHQLVLAGRKDWDFPRLIRQVVDRGLADRVRFPGYVTEEDLPAMTASADLFVFPSLYEGFGLPALDAMACGTMVLAADTSSIPEVVGRDGEGGDLLPADDPDAWAAAIRRWIDDPSGRAERGRAAARRAAGFTWDRTARETAEVYRAVVGRS